MLSIVFKKSLPFVPVTEWLWLFSDDQETDCLPILPSPSEKLVRFGCPVSYLHLSVRAEWISSLFPINHSLRLRPELTINHLFNKFSISCSFLTERNKYIQDIYTSLLIQTGGSPLDLPCFFLVNKGRNTLTLHEAVENFFNHIPFFFSVFLNKLKVTFQFHLHFL